MAAGIFQDMVMQEAIKDKTIQVEKQLKDEQGKVVATCCDHDGMGGATVFHMKKQDSDDEDLEAMDGEEEMILRQLRDQRMAEVKNKYQEAQENKIKGHG
jgi:hypothetical protein